MERTFDRLVEFDDRSRGYSVATLTHHRPDPRSYTWAVNHWLDQGREGACVGFAWTHELVGRPAEVNVPAAAAYAQALYREAQRHDQWPGEDYEGTSVIAAARLLRARGLIPEYRWAFSTQDALSAISRHGPAVIGVNWYEGMYDTDENGFIHPTGKNVGGHALLVNGVSITKETVTLHNSWGRWWGENGTAKMTWSDFDRLLGEYGECCIPVVRQRS